MKTAWRENRKLALAVARKIESTSLQFQSCSILNNDVHYSWERSFAVEAVLERKNRKKFKIVFRIRKMLISIENCLFLNNHSRYNQFS
jgi:hypothetical protein